MRHSRLDDPFQSGGDNAVSTLVHIANNWGFAKQFALEVQVVDMCLIMCCFAIWFIYTEC